MDPVNTHGVSSWTELMTPDPARAADFYHQLFGWTFQTRAMPDLPEGYRVAHLEGEPVAGIMPMPPDAPPAMPPHWGSYVTVDNVDETAGECAALGGRAAVAVAFALVLAAPVAVALLAALRGGAAR